jgi:hypothetical protein
MAKSMNFNMVFSLDYIVTSVDSGGLQITSTGQGVKITPSDVDYGHSDSVSWEPPWDFVGQFMQRVIMVDFNGYLDSYRNEFLTALHNQHKLILPGVGEYLCNQVTFSTAGDLLTNLAFNGYVYLTPIHDDAC